jgi:sarcosine oxidase subunit alpha
MSSSQPQRLPEPWGSRLNRSRRVAFRFENRDYEGYEGDTLASALAANGEWLLSRSFKYHRPRAALTWSGLDANSYVQVGDEPNVLADMLPVSDGLDASGQNYIGSLKRDAASVTGYMSRILPVGFYYRAFFRPNGIWPFWERFFRVAAGLGKINKTARRSYFDKQYQFCDVAVIGAGPAGLSAALAAAEAGADVTVVDEAAELGGSLNYARFQRERIEVESLRDGLLDGIRKNGRITVLTGASCSGWFSDNWLAVYKSKRLIKLRAKYVIACTGSIEQPLVFRNNDLPGVLPASGVQRLLRLYGIKPGDRAVVATANVEGYDVAKDLLDAGIIVRAIVDLNPEAAHSESANYMSAAGIETLRQCAISEAIPGAGKRSITAVVVSPIAADGTVSDGGRRIDCNLLVTSVGYTPLGQLACHSGASLSHDTSVNSFSIKNLPPSSSIAGSLNHRYTLESVLADGHSAGLSAALAVGLSVQRDDNGATDSTAKGMNHPYPIFAHPKGKEFVDFDEDQTIADLQNAVADGFEHAELAKRYSTVGMGPSQGRLSSLNALRIVQRCNGALLDGSQATTQRPPFRPLLFGALAGRPLSPERLTPIHDWHTDNGAVMMPAGNWQRPAYYASVSKREDAIANEVAAVRNNVGVIDVSTLGGIEVRGADAAEFLNRLYTFAYAKQPAGRSRYLLMTDDSGGIIDDGVACRLSDDHFYVTTTTTGSDAVYRDMLHRNAEWQLDVNLLNVTSTYAGISIAGPESRVVVDQLDSNIDFSSDTFPYLGVRQGKIFGADATAIRVGFVGELGYELHVPWSQALAVWQAIFEAGASAGIRAVGVEAQRILRLEKGHIIVGQDTDGLSTPREAALDWAIAGTKPYFVGKAALRIIGQRPLSRKLVGFSLVNAADPVPQECHLVIRDNSIVGRVTSVAYSATLEKVIGLAYVAADQAEPGSDFTIKTASGKLVTAIVEATPFYDRDNLRQQM